MSADMSVIGLLMEASIPVQIVMLLLIGASLVSWSIIFTKRRLIRRRQEASDEFADSSRSGSAPGVDAGRAGRRGRSGRGGTFGHHDDGGVAAVVVAAADLFGNDLDVEGLFGDENSRRSPGDARTGREVTGVTAHDLEHHEPVV